jgi:hypothetical protein
VARKIVVMPGPRGLDLSMFSSTANEFGWDTEITDDLTGPAERLGHRGIAAVYFCRDAVGLQYSWTDALRMLQSTMPDKPLVPCYGFSEPVDWDELCNAGAFHSLWLPLKRSELRQCLGFVWQALERGRIHSTTVPMRMTPRRSSRRHSKSLPYAAAS